MVCGCGLVRFCTIKEGLGVPAGELLQGCYVVCALGGIGTDTDWTVGSREGVNPE